MAADNQEYIPGVCNIGQAEIRQRLVIGWVSLAVTVAAWAMMIIWRFAPPWRLVLFFPATMVAAGFLQSAWHFCAKFGLKGVFNFGPIVGKTDTVEQAESRRQDRRTALAIIGLSMLTGVGVAAVAFWLSS